MRDQIRLGEDSTRQFKADVRNAESLAAVALITGIPAASRHSRAGGNPGTPEAMDPRDKPEDDDAGQD